MARLVADASIIVDYLTGSPAGARFRRALGEPNVDLHVPHLADLEVLSGLRRVTMIRRSNVFHSREAIVDFLGLPLHRHPHQLLLTEVWALRDRFSVYDGSYVALAMMIGARILTSDARMARGIKSLDAGLLA